MNGAMSMVILAGGKSRRMGRDKSDLLYNGKTFLEIQIEKGRTLGIEDILVSGYRGKICSARVISDQVREKGPLGGLAACFREAKHARCLVLSVDTVLVPAELLSELIRAAETNSAPATILRHGDHEESLIGVYNSDLSDEMEREFTEYKGSVFAFLRRIGYQTFNCEADSSSFANVNHPEEYEELIRRMEHSRQES